MAGGTESPDWMHGRRELPREAPRAGFDGVQSVFSLTIHLLRVR